MLSACARSALYLVDGNKAKLQLKQFWEGDKGTERKRALNAVYSSVLQVLVDAVRSAEVCC